MELNTYFLGLALFFTGVFPFTLLVFAFLDLGSSSSSSSSCKKILIDLTQKNHISKDND